MPKGGYTPEPGGVGRKKVLTIQDGLQEEGTIYSGMSKRLRVTEGEWPGAEARPGRVRENLKGQTE
jgi:hypothetical protein